LSINKQHLKDKENDKAKTDDDGKEDKKKSKKDKKKKKKAKKDKKKKSKSLSDDELAQLVDIPKDTGVLIVFEGPSVRPLVHPLPPSQTQFSNNSGV
jgi:hypothetical protein